jgi:hypothetical protein
MGMVESLESYAQISNPIRVLMIVPGMQLPQSKACFVRWLPTGEQGWNVLEA